MPYKDPNDPRKKESLKRGSAKHYKENRLKVLINTYQIKQRNRQQWIDFKRTLKCTFCAEDHPATLDFHHTDPSKKDREVSYYVKNYQYARAMQEVEKCLVVCANCHRKLHWEENSRKVAKKKPRRSGVKSAAF